jgi:hypothetical protein
MRRNLNDHIRIAAAAVALIGGTWLSPLARGQADPFNETDPAAGAAPAAEAPATETPVEGPFKPAGAPAATKSAAGTGVEEAAAADPDLSPPNSGGAPHGIERSKPSENIAELLAAAMTRNPDIAVAEAKVRSAQVELDRARLDVSRQIIEAVQAIRLQRRVVEVAGTQLASSKERQAMTEARYRQANITATQVASAQASVATAELSLAEAEAKLEAAIASLDYLTGSVAAPYGGPAMPGMGSIPGIGLPGGMTPGGPSYPASGAAAAPESKPETKHRSVTPKPTRQLVGPLSGGATGMPRTAEPYHQRLRRTLDEPTAFEFRDTPLADVLAYLDDLHGISNLVVDRSAESDTGRNFGEETITLKLDNVPLNAALKAIEDIADVSFVVTSYGLVLTVKDTGIKDRTPLKDFLAGSQFTRAPGSSFGPIRNVYSTFGETGDFIDPRSPAHGKAFDVEEKTPDATDPDAKPASPRN